MTTRHQAEVARTTRSNLRGLFIVGFIALVVGGAMVGAMWPQTEIVDGFSGPRAEETGSLPGSLMGLALIAGGQILVAVPVIAWGVMQGIEAHTRPSD